MHNPTNRYLGPVPQNGPQFGALLMDQMNFMVGSIISIYRFEAEVKVALLSWLTSKECF
jgi:hypothetical protein